MSQIVVVGTFHLAEGQEEAGIAAFQDLALRSLEEDGCLSYVIHRDTQDPRALTGIEHWASHPSLDAHMQQPYVAELIGRADDLLDEPFSLKVLAPIVAV
ncbi:MAG: putative quinol monooxygenase [Solirubrobacteraceae bacterium]|nr:putative quinol monooxygenase [Patulibacter sp.]